MSRLGPLALRDFRLMFVGRTISLLGGSIANVALAFAVLDLTGSPTDLGFVLAARTIPMVLFVLVGGVWADRLPRHLVMVAANVGSALVQGATAILLLTGTAEVWHLIALQFVGGASWAFFFPAAQGLVPQLVPEQTLQQANALLRLGMNASLISGAAIGGLIVAAVGSGWAIAFDALTFAASATALAFVRIPRGERLEARNFLGELREGWDEFWSRTWLWAIVLQFLLVNAFGNGAINVLGPLIARSELGGPAAWGLILSAGSAGLVAGGLLTLRFRPSRILLVATLVIFLEIPYYGLLAEAAPVAAIAVASFFGGIGIEIFGVYWDTALQQQIPRDRLSRVYSYDMLGSIVAIPIGLTVAGPVAERIGVRETVWSAAAIVAFATLAVLFVRDVRTLERREAIAASG